MSVIFVANAFKGAAELWEAYDLQVIQVRVGVIMAVEWAQERTKLVFKLTRGEFLADAIKAFLKAITGIDL